MSTSVAETKSPIPHGWELPESIRRRFGSQSNHQRAFHCERHMAMRLHRVPERGKTAGDAVYFWRNATGGWKCSAGRDSIETITELIAPYADALAAIELRSESAATSADWFAILSDIGPLLRAVDSLCDTLQAAQQFLNDIDQEELQPACDLAHEIVRAAELLHQQSQHSIDHLVAQQNELLARMSQSQASAAHRLNVMAALFLPLATISSVFGMNIAHGFENSPLFFWLILGVGILLGVVIGSAIFKLPSWNPDTW